VAEDKRDVLRIVPRTLKDNITKQHYVLSSLLRERPEGESIRPLAQRQFDRVFQRRNDGERAFRLPQLLAGLFEFALHDAVVLVAVPTIDLRGGGQHRDGALPVALLPPDARQLPQGRRRTQIVARLLR